MSIADDVQSLLDEYHTPPAVRERVEAWIAAQRTGDSLDTAWAESEAALPEGWVIEGTRRVLMAGLPTMQRWGASACPLTPKGRNWRGIYETQFADGPTPAAALRALAARLRESR